MKQGKLSQSRLAVIAVPAHNEAACIAECLASLALQRDETGAPIGQGRFEILIYANNCSDATAAIARQSALSIPHPVEVFEEDMPATQRNAGWARKRAMDLAAVRLAEAAPIRGLILTTDADSRVAPTWLAATLREFDEGVDCVAGYNRRHSWRVSCAGSAIPDPRPVGRRVSSLCRRDLRSVRSQAVRSLAEPPRLVRGKPRRHACGVLGNRRPSSTSCRRGFGAHRHARSCRLKGPALNECLRNHLLPF